MKSMITRLISAGLVAGAGLLGTPLVLAHCDTMDGPVVIQAKTALEKKNITPVLKWIKPEHETELKLALARTLEVRSESAAARELADQYFFETLVRLHRLGEGAPYTGIKPAGTKVEPVIQAADQALETGKVDELIKKVTDEAAAGIRSRFTEAAEKRRHADHQVEAGREYVAAYVEFVHYVEALHAATARPGAAHEHKEIAAKQEKSEGHEPHH